MMPLFPALPSRATAWRLVMVGVAATLALLQGLAVGAPDTGFLPSLLGTNRAEPIPPLRPVAEASPDRWAAILERPLFHPDRRPWVESVPEPAVAVAPVAVAPDPAQSQVAEPPNGILLGTVINGSRNSALVRGTSSPHPAILRRGDSVDGWTVQAIERGRMVLERDGLRFELALPGPH